MARGHQTLDNAVLLVKDLDQRGQGVGGARRVRHDLEVWGVVGVIHSHDKHGRGLGRSRDEHLLSSIRGLQVAVGRVQLLEDAGRLDDIVHTARRPGNVLGVALIEHSQCGSIDREGLLRVLDGAGIASVHGIVLELVRHVLCGDEGVVQGDHHDLLGVCQGRSQHETSDPSESVDSYSLGCHLHYEPLHQSITRRRAHQIDQSPGCVGLP